MTLREQHREDHHRYEWAVGHLHWDGTDDDRNFGQSCRPRGWSAGEDVHETRWPPVGLTAARWHQQASAGPS